MKQCPIVIKKCGGNDRRGMSGRLILAGVTEATDVPSVPRKNAKRKNKANAPPPKALVHFFFIKIATFPQTL